MAKPLRANTNFASLRFIEVTKKLMLKEERSPTRCSKYFQAVHSVHPFNFLRVIPNPGDEDRRAPRNDRQVDMPFCPSHPRSSLSSDFQRKGRNSVLPSLRACTSTAWPRPRANEM